MYYVDSQVAPPGQEGAAAGGREGEYGVRAGGVCDPGGGRLGAAGDALRLHSAQQAAEGGGYAAHGPQSRRIIIEQEQLGTSPRNIRLRDTAPARKRNYSLKLVTVAVLWQRCGGGVVVP